MTFFTVAVLSSVKKRSSVPQYVCVFRDRSLPRKNMRAERKARPGGFGWKRLCPQKGTLRKTWQVRKRYERTTCHICGLNMEFPANLLQNLSIFRCLRRIVHWLCSPQILFQQSCPRKQGASKAMVATYFHLVSLPARCLYSQKKKSERMPERMSDSLSE